MLGKLIVVLDWVEKLAIAGVIGGFLFFSTAPQVLEISLLVLSVTFAVRVNIPAFSAESGKVVITKAEHVLVVVLPKLIWVCCSLAVLGFYVFVLYFQSGGLLYKRFVLVGGYGLGVWLLCMFGIILVAKPTQRAPYYMPVLARALPIFIASMYLLYA